MPYRQHTDNQRAFTVTPFVYDVIQAGQSCSVSGSDSPIIENQEVYLFQLFTELPVFQKSSFSGLNCSQQVSKSVCSGSETG